MLGKNLPFDEIGFFWTRQWDKSLHYTGHATQFDDVIIEGDLNKLDFIAYYVNEGKVVAAAGMNK